MLAIYQYLSQIALHEFENVVSRTELLGGTPASPDKLRLLLLEGSFIDIWLSADGDYAYHWERRRQNGKLYRWDNAPHHPRVATFPDHFHEGDDRTIVESHLSLAREMALREVLEFVSQQL